MYVEEVSSYLFIIIQNYNNHTKDLAELSNATSQIEFHCTLFIFLHTTTLYITQRNLPQFSIN